MFFRSILLILICRQMMARNCLMLCDYVDVIWILLVSLDHAEVYEVNLFLNYSFLFSFLAGDQSSFTLIVSDNSHNVLQIIPFSMFYQNYLNLEIYDVFTSDHKSYNVVWDRLFYNLIELMKYHHDHYMWIFFSSFELDPSLVFQLIVVFFPLFHPWDLRRHQKFSPKANLTESETWHFCHLHFILLSFFDILLPFYSIVSFGLFWYYFVAFLLVQNYILCFH